jgi:hypothetical protein
MVATKSLAAGSSHVNSIALSAPTATKFCGLCGQPPTSILSSGTKVVDVEVVDESATTEVLVVDSRVDEVVVEVSD